MHKFFDKNEPHIEWHSLVSSTLKHLSVVKKNIIVVSTY